MPPFLAGALNPPLHMRPKLRCYPAHLFLPRSDARIVRDSRLANAASRIPEISKSMSLASTLSIALVLLSLKPAILTRALASTPGPGHARSYASESETSLSMLRRAQALIAQGDLAEAREELVRGAKAFPHEAAFFNLLGVVDAEENDGRAAEGDFRKAISESPHYRGAYLNLGHLYEVGSLRNPAERQDAVQTYRALLEFDPGNIEANYQYAVLKMQQGAFSDSLSHLLSLPAGDRRKAQVLAIICADHARLGAPGAAAKDADRLISAPELVEADVLPVIPVLSAHRELPLAVRIMEGLEQRHLATAHGLEQLGILLEQSGQLQKARNSLNAAAREETGAARPLIELARVANRQHDYRGALGYLAHARDLEPENASIHFFFGMVCVELDLHHEAYVSLKRAVQLDPGNAYYNFALGAVCTQRQDATEAVKYFKRYCELKPQDRRGALALGAAYYYSHNLNLARTHLLKVSRDKATAAAANYYLGRIANDSGNWPEAVEDLQRAIDEHPGYADAYAALGDAYLNERKYREARQALAHSIKLEPDNYLANLNLMVLYGRTKSPLAPAQARRFAQVRKEREERAKLFLRTIRVEP
jgi:tetratricopeptide (TPR) repeat protein